ncbi:PAS domain S-box protein [Desulfobulbus elongatus]|uniref:PAS domain S-box protein n=1 Tax=Desulfobulbus elongatus TaxID=53332 RepID=UPI00146FC639|nr:PAS domain S-box protein [Desulfobulbus elongatus]
MNGLKNEIARFSPLLDSASPGDGRQCRLHFLRTDVRILVLLLSVGVGFNLLWLRADHLFLRGTAAFPWILGLRFALIGLSLWTIAVVRRTDDPARFDRWSFLWAIACAIAGNLITLSRPETYIGHVIVEPVVIIGLYALQPSRALLRAVPPLLFSLGSLTIFFAKKVAVGSMTSLSVVSAYSFANLIGWVVSTNWQRSRRESFCANRLLAQWYRQAEEGWLAAEASERNLERIIDASPSMLFVVDTQQRITRVNQTFVDCLGITRRQALGRRCCELLCGTALSPDTDFLHDLLNQEKPCTRETRFLPFGSDCRIMAAPLFDRVGLPEATVFIVQDITEEKRAERELRATREMYRSLVRDSHGIIYTIRPDGVVTYVSPSFTRLLGYAPEFIVGKHFRVIVHPEDVPACAAFQRKLLTDAEVAGGIENRVIHRDGSVRWHFSSLNPCHNEAGSIEWFVGNAIDITELKRYQVELDAAREAAEKANKAKSEFLAMISHEIRTPLNAMVGFSALARQTTDVARLKEYVDILDQSSRLLMDLVNNILDTSKAEAGQLHLESIPFNLPDAIDLLHWQYAPIAARKQLAFLVHREASVPAWVSGDPIRFRQVVANLLSNAIKFTETGEVCLTVRGAGPAEQEGGLMVRLEVRDTGIGIDESGHELLFQPFLQLDPGTARKYGGSGLGLAIVRRLVELMHGRIEVASRFGRGSCFTVELPFLPAVPPQGREVEVASVGSLALLVVEDNVYNRLHLRDTLRLWGHAVTEAATARHALDLLSRHRYDAVVLDIRMPDMDGIELTRRLREEERSSHRERTPVVAFTADTETTTTERCLAAGMQAVLFKPLDPRLLARSLETHCRKPEPPQGLPATPEEGSPPAPADNVRAGLGPDPVRMNMYLGLLREDMVRELDRLDRALLAEDRDLCQAVAHSLKGLCGSLQDKRPAELAASLYVQAPFLPFSELRALVARLRAAGRCAEAGV